jgi:hypothetical protein
MAQIFISYRRRDSGYLVDDLKEKLKENFGPNNVFYDIDSVPLGVDFRKYIGDAVGQCDVLLVIIGDQWAGPTDSPGKRRIDDPTDSVRIEIESALKRNIPVIPVLMDEATMASLADLPASIESIAFRNATEIRSGRDRRQHIEQLIEGLEKLFAANDPLVTLSSDELPGRTEAKRRSIKRPTSAKKPGGKVSQRSELLEGIQKTLKDCADSHLYLGEAIPADKLANAIGSYAPGVSPKDVLLFFDNTVFGGAKDGLLLTGKAVYWHNISSKPGQIKYADIEAVLSRVSDGIFAAAKILINQEQIDLQVGDKNKLAEALANVIRYLTEQVKR